MLVEIARSNQTMNKVNIDFTWIPHRFHVESTWISYRTLVKLHSKIRKICQFWTLFTPQPDMELFWKGHDVLYKFQFSSPSAAALGEQYFKKSVCLFVCLFNCLFLYFIHLRTPTGIYPENFMRIGLDLAEILRI